MSVSCYEVPPDDDYYEPGYTPVLPTPARELTQLDSVQQLTLATPVHVPVRPTLVLLPSVTDTPLQAIYTPITPIVDESVEFAATAAKVSTDLSKLVAELNCRGSAGAEESLKRIMQAGRFIGKILRYEAKRFGGVLGQPRLFEVT